jgi:uncharacterized protein
MELVNEFTVNASIEETWRTLTSLETIAPCMPGAQLTEIEGDIYRGNVKIKVGPITALFKGQAIFLEQDHPNYRAVLKGDGRDTGGKGNASAIITAQMESVSPTVTKTVVTTDLTITGKVAQFGRGALADVSDKLLKQFVHNLETQVLTGDTAAALAADVPAAAAAAATEAPAAEAAAKVADAPTTETPKAEAPKVDEPPKVRKIDSKPVEPIDLIETAGAATLKRVAPIAAIALLLLFLLKRRR